MKRLIAIIAIAAASIGAHGALAQTSGAQQAKPPVAGTAPLGVTVTEMEAVVLGWSAKHDLLGKNVMNDNKQKIGKIDDIIISTGQGGKATVAPVVIIGAGGFLGMGKHDVAIPTDQLKIEGTNIILPGATKDALKAMPEFQYQKKK
jgi:sporulation protein YlmC with PRC-barrel domain